MTIHGQRAEYIIFDDYPNIQATQVRWIMTRISKKAFKVTEGDTWSKNTLRVIRAGPVEANRQFKELVTLRKIALRLKGNA